MKRNRIWSASVLSLGVVLALAGCERDPETPSTDATVAPETSAPAAATPPAQPAAAATTDAPPPLAASTGPARLDGFGPLTFGDDPAKLRQTWQGKLLGDAPGPEACWQTKPDQTDAGGDVIFMIEGDRFVRYDVLDAALTAPGGGKVGMPLGVLEPLYAGRAKLLPHKYDEQSRNLSVAPAADGQGGLNFEIGPDGTVKQWRAGVAPQVDYVEGCG